MIDDRTGIREAVVQPYRLPFRRPWRSAAGELGYREGWILRVVDAGGQTALGECAPLPGPGAASPEEAEGALRLWARRLPGLSLADAWRVLDEEPTPPAARCAVEAAILFLAARRRGLPPARLINPGARGQVLVNAAVGCADTGLAARVREAVAEGFRVQKVKVGVGNPDEELDLLRSAAQAGTAFRLDANGAWDLDTARSFLAAAASLTVESIEEPLAGADPGHLRDLADSSPCPIALDESLPGFLAAGAATELPAARIVLKPMVLGGVRPCLRLAAAARREVVVTTSLEAAPGRWLAAHLAAALDSGLCHGLDTGRWFAEDLGPGPGVSGGTCRVFG